MCSTPNSNSYPYSSKTLINNWNEDQFLLQSLTASYVEKLRTSKSLLEHTKSVVEHFYEDVQLEAPCTYISYGATIQICAIDFRPSGAAAAAEPLMLSLYLDANHMRRTPYHLTQHCDVSVAPGERPCRRNTFVVRSADARERLGEPLRYGDAFNLQLTEPDANGAPLVLYSAPQTVSRLDGSCPSMSLGVCQRHERSDEHRLGLSVTPPLHCNWKALYIQPNLRYEMEGEPVPSNERIVISHAATNRNLAVEDVWTRNYFGREARASVEIFQSVHRIETAQNVWILKTSEKL